MDTIWQQTQTLLQQKLEAGLYKVWIGPLEGQYQDLTLTLYARNDFVAGFVRSRFLAVIEESVTELCAGPVAVTIRAAQVAAATGSTPPPRPAHTSTESHDSRPLSSRLAPLSSGAPGAPGVQEGRQATESGIGQYSLPLTLSHQSFTTRSWRYSFDDFIVGPSNELAFAAARSLCGAARSSDMLFLSSAAGLGKTHLTQAVGHELCLCSNRRAPKVEYLTAEEFASNLFLAIKTQQTDRFKARYRDVDVLLLEDVHFLQGKEKMQDELLATLKTLQDKGSKIVFSSSFIPRDMRTMNDQLLSRFSSGFIAVIDKPNRETRKRIISEKAKFHQVLLPEDVSDFLADSIQNDVRQIESCIHNLILKAKLLNCSITMQLAHETIENYAGCEKSLDFEGIVRYVCQGFGISPDQINSKSRRKELVTARNTVFYLARKHTELSLGEIGGRLNRSHSTVIKGITSLEREISRESSLGRQLSGTIAIIERNGGIISASS